MRTGAPDSSVYCLRVKKEKKEEKPERKTERKGRKERKKNGTKNEKIGNRNFGNERYFAQIK